MKSAYRLLSLVLSLLFIVSCCAIVTPAVFATNNNSNENHLLGDINSDGKVNSGDARLALRYAARLEQVDKDSIEYLSADVNGDDRINSSDARMILRVAAKLEVFQNKYIVIDDQPSEPVDPSKTTPDSVPSDIESTDLPTGKVNHYPNDDKVFSSSNDTISFDQETNIVYYNNLINVYTVSDLSDSEAEDLASSIKGTVVGNISGNINLIQILVDESTLEVLVNKCNQLMKNEKVLYADYAMPFIVGENSFNSDPWNDDPSNPDSSRNNESNPNGNDWWAEAIQAYSAWRSVEDRRNSINVGVIDSGFYNNHDDLRGRISFLDSYSRNTADTHGTHVSGLIAAANNTVGIRGVCDNANLYCVDWSPETNDTAAGNYINYLSTGEYLEIIKQLIDHDVKVINNSWGQYVQSKDGYTQGLYEDHEGLKYLLQYFAVHTTGAYDSYMDYINAAAKRTGIQCIILIAELLLNGKEDFLIVQAAGNGYDNGGAGLQTDLAGFFCAIDEDLFNSIPEVTRTRLAQQGINYETIEDHKIIVGAVKNETNYSGSYKMTSFSNYGENVDICAPGENIYSTWYDTSTQSFTYHNDSGTSMAAPIVCGSAALLWSVEPDTEARRIKKYLTEDHSVLAYGVGDNTGATYPMLNVSLAIDHLKKDAEWDKTLKDIAFGNVVSDGKDIYYWKYNSNTFSFDAAVSGSYTYNVSATNDLICRKETGEESIILSANGVGVLGVVNNRIFYQEVPENYNYNNFNIKSCALDGSDIRDHGQGIIRGIIDHGRYLIVQDVNYGTSGIYSIDTSSLLRTEISNYSYLICSDERVIVYDSNSDVVDSLTEVEHTFYQVTGDGSANYLTTEQAGDLPSISTPEEYSSGWIGGYISVDTPFVFGDDLFYLYEHIAGTGHVTQSARIIRFNLQTGDKEEIIGNIEWDSGTISQSDIDATDESTKAFVSYLANQNHIDVLSKEDYADFSSSGINPYGDENNILKVEYCENLGSKTYALLSYGSFTEWMGWRAKYRFIKCALFEKDSETGLATMIYTTEQKDTQGMSMYDAYSEVIHETYSTLLEKHKDDSFGPVDDYCSYALFDIDHDGTSELIIWDQAGPFGIHTSFLYTFNGREAVFLGERGMVHAGYYVYENQLISIFQQGEQDVAIIGIKDGQLTSELLAHNTQPKEYGLPLPTWPLTSDLGLL